MSRFDYNRFLRSAADYEEVVGSLAERLLCEKKISQAERDVLVTCSRRVLESAYMAGRCEPVGVQSVQTELAKVST